MTTEVTFIKSDTACEGGAGVQVGCKAAYRNLKYLSNYRYGFPADNFTVMINSSRDRGTVNGGQWRKKTPWFLSGSSGDHNQS